MKYEFNNFEYCGCVSCGAGISIAQNTGKSLKYTVYLRYEVDHKDKLIALRCCKKCYKELYKSIIKILKPYEIDYELNKVTTLNKPVVNIKLSANNEEFNISIMVSTKSQQKLDKLINDIVDKALIECD